MLLVFPTTQTSKCTKTNAIPNNVDGFSIRFKVGEIVDFLLGNGVGGGVGPIDGLSVAIGVSIHTFRYAIYQHCLYYICEFPYI